MGGTFAQQVSYRVLKSSNKLPVFQLGLVASTLETSFSFKNLDLLQVNAGPGIDARLHLSNILHVRANGYVAKYVDMQNWFAYDETLRLENVDEMDNSRAYAYDLGVEFTPFVKKSNNSPIPVTLKSKDISRTMAEVTTINAKGKAASFFGFRGGLTRYRTNFGGNLTTEDGTVFRDHYATLRGNALYAGVTWGAASYVKIFANGYGTKEGGGLTKIYADVMFGPESNVEMVQGGQTYKIVASEEVNFGENALGFRMGVELTSIKTVGFGVVMEGGVKPGYGSMPYFRLDFQLPLINIGRLEGKEKS